MASRVVDTRPAEAYGSPVKSWPVESSRSAGGAEQRILTAVLRAGALTATRGDHMPWRHARTDPLPGGDSDGAAFCVHVEVRHRSRIRSVALSRNRVGICPRGSATRRGARTVALVDVRQFV